MPFGLKCATRGVERDNEEAVIGTQLWFGDKRLPRTGRHSLKDANRTASNWFRQLLK